MSGIQEQQKRENVLNRSQRRTPLNVVVEKFGSASAVVHGDLSKETLKELLMSELSLISKVQSSETKDAMDLSKKKSLTHGISETSTKGDKENIFKKSKTQEEGRELKTVKESKLKETDKQELKSEKDYRNTDKIFQEHNKNVSNEFQKGQKDIFENEVSKKEEEENRVKEKETSKQDKIIVSNEDPSNNENKTKDGKDGKKYKGGGMSEKQNEDKEKEKQGKIREDKEIVKKSDINYKSEEAENVKKDGKGKGTKTETTKVSLDRKGKNEYEDQEMSIERDQTIASQQVKDFLQKKEKLKITDHTVKSLFKRKDLKKKEKEIISGKVNKEIGRFIKKAKNSTNNGHFDVITQIEEISADEDFTEDYDKEEKESCFSKISCDKDILALSYDGKWLKQYLKKPLILALNEIVEKKPKDPVTYLGFWLLSYRSSQENLQRKRVLETELLAKRNEWNMLHAETKTKTKLIVEEEVSMHSEEGENIVDWNFSNYGFR